MKPIGINNFVIFGIDARVDSSFDSVFDNNQQLNVSDGLAGDIRRATIGDITELYPILKTEISNLETSDIQAIAKVVYKIVTQYFGDFSNIKYRLTNYPSEDSITNDSELGVISDLKGKNAAMCVERAAVSQNLLQLIGI